MWFSIEMDFVIMILQNVSKSMELLFLLFNLIEYIDFSINWFPRHIRKCNNSCWYYCITIKLLYCSNSWKVYCLSILLYRWTKLFLGSLLFLSQYQGNICRIVCQGTYPSLFSASHKLTTLVKSQSTFF